ncbi:hypothetical protein FH972_000885 [Carpinus fangiana]|uniref:Uncharacterized protein n=1 Tax=Carpinus fangiana TaxID=176857 RepID=A0A5N6QA82_9ROSI|nr:hypothetical protein FH972_000885 [Carpinus fangiana]
MATPPDLDKFRNWLDLPRDVTASILLRLGAIEILTSDERADGVLSVAQTLQGPVYVAHCPHVQPPLPLVNLRAQKYVPPSRRSQLRPVGGNLHRVLWRRRAPQPHR